jgi:hypothetical protein
MMVLVSRPGLHGHVDEKMNRLLHEKVKFMFLNWGQ